MVRLSHNRAIKTVVFDTESESLSLFCRPWQLAYSIVQNNKIIKTIERYPWFPDLKVSPKAAQITGFKWEKYKDLATPAADVFEEFAQYLYNDEYLLAGHNIISFDFPMVKSLGKAAGMWKGWSFAERALDTLCLSRHYHNGTKPSSENFFGDQLKLIGKPPRGSKKATLSAMAKEFSIDFDPTKLHDAAEDIKLNVGVLNKLIYALDI
jgi:DNA polymerase III epsilon subunit-like protein